jgi:hypothetical protein
MLHGRKHTRLHNGATEELAVNNKKVGKNLEKKEQDFKSRI